MNCRYLFVGVPALLSCQGEAVAPVRAPIGSDGGVVIAVGSGSTLTVPAGVVTGTALDIKLYDTTLTSGTRAPLSRTSLRLLVPISGSGVTFSAGGALKLEVPESRAPQAGARIFFHVTFPATSEEYWANAMRLTNGSIRLDIPLDQLGDIVARNANGMLDVIVEPQEFLAIDPLASSSGLASDRAAILAPSDCQPLPSDATAGEYAPCGTTLLHRLSASSVTGGDAIVLVHGWKTSVGDWVSYYEAQGINCGPLACSISTKVGLSLPGQRYFATLIPQLQLDFPNAAIYVFNYESFREYSETGRGLAALLTLEQRTQQFARVVLVGHSMGGLVARTAAQRLPSTSSVPLKGIVTLGTPHEGTPLPADLWGNWLYSGVPTPGGASLLFTLDRDESTPLFLFGGDISNRGMFGDYEFVSKRLCSKYQKCQNDGAVPTSSARASSGSFTDSGITRHEVFADYDHSDMKGGKQPFASDPLYLTLRTDLLSLLPVVAPPARNLAFRVSTPYRSANYGMPWDRAVQVEIRDNSGNLLTSATDSVVLTLATNPDGATLTGARAAAVDGVAVFPDLAVWVQSTGPSYTLQASGIAGSSMASAIGEIFYGNPVGDLNVVGYGDMTVRDSTIFSVRSYPWDPVQVVRTSTTGWNTEILMSLPGSLSGTGFYRLATDGTNVYSTGEEQGQSRIWRVPVAGGGASILARDFRLGSYQLELAAGRLFYAVVRGTQLDTIVVQSLPVGGGTPADIVTIPNRGGVLFAVAGDFIYYTDYGLGIIARTPISGGPAQTIATGVSANANSLLVAGSRLYWAESFEIRSAPLGGGSSSTLVSGSGVFYPRLLVSDSAYLYAVHQVINGGMQARRYPLAGGASSGIIASPQAIDSNSIYFQSGAYPGGATSIKKASKSLCIADC